MAEQWRQHLCVPQPVITLLNGWNFRVEMGREDVTHLQLLVEDEDGITPELIWQWTRTFFSIAEGLIILYHSINHFNWPPANPKYFPDIGLPTITIEKKLQPISAFLNTIILLLLLPLQSDCFTINVSITASWTRWGWLCLFQTVEKGHLWPSDFIEMRPSASFMLTSSHRRVGYLSEMKADIPFSSTYSPLCHHRPCHS